MKTRILARWEALSGSYWFLPALMAVGALVLAYLTTSFDQSLDPLWVQQNAWLSINEPAGARVLLSTVAGSMIGVAGVSFSITIASVVYASGQYGPRLLTNFMHDRGNQFTLGTFIATFLYCLLVLRTVRSMEQVRGEVERELLSAFVPYSSVLTAVALAILSIGVLIYFIHHVPESIHVSNVISDIGHQLAKKLESQFPQEFGGTAPAHQAAGGPLKDQELLLELPQEFTAEAVPITSATAGYVQGIDDDELLGAGTKHQVLLRLMHRPGDFTRDGDVIALAWSPTGVNDEVHSSVRLAYAWGRSRTPMQDARFLVNELVEIAARALSPGVNDAFTAMSCLDWLGNALLSLGKREFPSCLRFDDQGELRVIVPKTEWEEFIRLAFGQLRPYISADKNAALHALQLLHELSSDLPEERHSALVQEAKALLESTEAQVASQADRAEIRARYRDLFEA